MPVKAVQASWARKPHEISGCAVTSAGCVRLALSPCLFWRHRQVSTTPPTIPPKSSPATSSSKIVSLSQRSFGRIEIASVGLQPLVDFAAGEPGHTGITSTIEQRSVAADGWQYCLASSPREKKVYISTPFAKIADLKLTQATFAESLAQTEHDPVQCPVSKYPGTVHNARRRDRL